MKELERHGEVARHNPFTTNNLTLNEDHLMTSEHIEDAEESATANSSSSQETSNLNSEPCINAPSEAVNEIPDSAPNKFQIMPKLVARWSSLVGLDKHKPSRVGVQKPDGNYPLHAFADSMLPKHFSGQETIAVPVSFVDAATKESFSLFLALDFDDIAVAEEASSKTLGYLSDLGIPAYTEFSGKKGVHVFIFLDEPIPTHYAVQFVKHLKQVNPFKGECIPGDNSQIKMGPCVHQNSGNLAYFIPSGEGFQLFTKQDLPQILPAQLALLRSFKRASAQQIIAFVTQVVAPEQPSNPEDTLALLSKLPENSHPECIRRLVENGGAASLGTFDKNALRLASYLNAGDLPPELEQELIDQFVAHENSPIATSKDVEAKRRCMASVKSAASTQNGFFCATILSALKELKFSCKDCPARPEGLRVSSSKTTRTSSQKAAHCEWAP